MLTVLEESVIFIMYNFNVISVNVFMKNNLLTHTHGGQMCGENC